MAVSAGGVDRCIVLGSTLAALPLLCTALHGFAFLCVAFAIATRWVSYRSGYSLGTAHSLCRYIGVAPHVLLLPSDLSLPLLHTFLTRATVPTSHVKVQ